MSANNWGALRPDNVAGWINFDRNNSKWFYDKNSASMANRQAEGVAYLWNLLALHNVALLADEVGMGKTFQALGVASLLWKMKPDAKVLVMAPNRDICMHWRREFQTFVRDHYREVDHCVKNSANFGPIQSIQTCWRLADLAEAVESGTGHLYLTTIHSLSGLVPQSEEGENKDKIAAANAKKIHNRIKKVLGEDGFDLVIIDEAHYFRNVHGGSQRVSAARAFFGSDNNPLTSKALLLTATPSHSRLSDVESILSYFIDIEDEANRSVSELMNKFGLRRFRRMEGNGVHYSKHEYRREKDVPCGFEKRPESEMFFALYQKKLVTELKYTRDNRSILYGFLEGFESVGRTDANSHKENSSTDDDVEESTRVDFGKAADSALLGRLTQEYYELFSKFPEHPKYGELVGRCVPSALFRVQEDLHEYKHLVFVRRIPSVRELTQRINKSYDEILAIPIYRAWGFSDDDTAVKRWREQSWSRAGFDQLVRQLRSDDIEDVGFDTVDEGDEDSIETDSYLGSAIAELFVVKKGKEGRTDCSNVSLRFRKPESIFALFLEPSSDYQEAGYQYYYEYSKDEKARPDYVNAARDKRFSKHGLISQKSEMVKTQREKVNLEPEVKTVWALIYPLLEQEHQSKLKDWSKNRPGVAENFSNYVKSGFLFASPVIVELYSWFTEFNRNHVAKGAQQKYTDFVRFIVPKLPTSLMFKYFKSALESFETLCDKIIDHKSDEWGKDWGSLKRLQNPAWYASGQSDNRQRLILGFNSPFYPNVLVATSVFQEGVNLHLQCRKVHHYGIAWTPGDNEQRVGRVDRLFGKVNELLKVDGLSDLEIHYPFLKNTFDEEQVASFIAKKFDVEEKMDACVQGSSDRRVEQTQIDWKEFLRKPMKALTVKDPYEARFDEESLPPGKYIPFKNHSCGDIDRHVFALLNDTIEEGVETVYRLKKDKLYPNAMFLIDTVIKYDDQIRRQPILIEKHFSTDFSSLVSGTVYYISLKSPIASKKDLEVIGSDLFSRLPELCDRLHALYPLAKPSINEDLAMSHFYLNVSVELPAFVKHGCLGMLSKSEITMAYQHVKSFSDELEIELFEGQQDLAVEHLNLSDLLQQNAMAKEVVCYESFDSNRETEWEKMSLESGDVEYITGLYKAEALSGVNEKESLCLKMFHLNGKNPLVYFQASSANDCRVSIYYPAGDLQPDERLLMEKWHGLFSR